jgi:uncharacterized protein DUF6282
MKGTGMTFSPPSNQDQKMESAVKPVSPRFVLADQILQGAIDLHHHGYPEITFDVRTRHEDVEEYRHARDAGMAGIVLKSHMWPTVGRASSSRRRCRASRLFRA